MSGHSKLAKSSISIALMVCTISTISLLRPRLWANTQPNSQSLLAFSIPNADKSVVLDADKIRVGLTDDAMTQTEYKGSVLSANDTLQVLEKDTGKILGTIPPNTPITITRKQDFFLIAGKDKLSSGPFHPHLLFKPIHPGAFFTMPEITRNGKIPSYRGQFEAVASPGNPEAFTLINVLPMQDYLKAVVPNELPPSFGFEALKAQAVAARNYAIHPREKPWKSFDICDSQYCQAYYGVGTEHPLATKALQETQGLVALYQGTPILALYSSTNGGYSEFYENAFSDQDTNRFPGTPIPYLRGVPDVGPVLDLSSNSAAFQYYANRPPASFDRNSPLYRWQREWPRTVLENAINKNLLECSQDKTTKAFIQPGFTVSSSIGQLQDIQVLQRSPSGKIMRLQLTGTHGQWTLEKEFVIRKVLKYNNKFLPSANAVFQFMHDPQGEIISIRALGGGLGHGVGMSQYGASFLSKSGKSFVAILQHYYQGVAIGTIPIEATFQVGMKTSFFATNPSGRLFIQGHPGTPVSVELNHKPIQLSPNEQGITQLDVGSVLRPKTLNELVLKPIANNQPPVKAWIELYAPANY